jgi:hypothetical protein
VELVYGDNDGIREVAGAAPPPSPPHPRPLPPPAASGCDGSAGGGAPPSAPASPCELRGPDCSSLMVRRRVCGCDGAGSWTCG